MKLEIEIPDEVVKEYNSTNKGLSNEMLLNLFEFSLFQTLASTEKTGKMPVLEEWVEKRHIEISHKVTTGFEKIFTEITK